MISVFLTRSDEKILGYAYASQWNPRAAYRWAVETSVYIRNGYHQKNYGMFIYSLL